MAGSVLERKFHYMPGWAQRAKRAWHLAKIEWAAKDGPFGAVVFQLRARARVFEARAWLILGVLLLVVIAGLGFYLYRPILQNQNEIERQVHEETVRLKNIELAALDTRRDELRDRVAKRVETVFVHRPVEGVTASLNDIEFGPSGEAVVVGSGGTILTRAAGSEAWERRSVEGVTATLIDIEFGPSGEAVIVGGNPLESESTILTRAAGAAAWQRQSVEGVTAMLTDIRFGPSGEAVIVGEDGTILTRATGAAAWERQPVARVTADLFNIWFGPSAEAVVVGSGGTILTRAAGSEAWERRSVEGVTETPLYIWFGPSGEAVIVGADGMILTRAAGAVVWQRQPVEGVTATLFDIGFGPSGEAVAVGSEGTILTRAAGAEAWEIVPSGTTKLLIDIEFTPSGEAVIVGGNPLESEGTILTRAAGSASWVRQSVEGVTARLFDIRFGPSGEAVIVGERGTILESTDRFAKQIGGATTDAALGQAMEALPTYTRDPLEGQQLSAIEAQRQQALKTEQEAKKSIAEADLGTLSRRQRRQEFEDYMKACAPEGAQAAEIAACADAYDKAMIQANAENVWALLARVVPPAVLLLFLLATLGGLYRYNLRMAGFYHARADALELQAGGAFSEAKFDALANVLAADRVEFRTTKTPTDNVTDIAKTLIDKLDLKKGG